MTTKHEESHGVGELIGEAVKAANDLGRVELKMLQDPRDGTDAVVVLGRNGVEALKPGLFDGWRVKPLTRQGTATHLRQSSFIDHVNRCKAENSALFAVDDPKSPGITAIFDYHPAGGDFASTMPGLHRALYHFPLSDEYKAWSAIDGKKLGRTEFAEFLEDRIVDVVHGASVSSPAAREFVEKVDGRFASPSELIALSRNLAMHEKSMLKDSRNLSSGEVELMFTSELIDAAGGKLVLPNLVMIQIPVFAREELAWQVIARLRFRPNGGNPVFWFELWRFDLVFAEAFNEAAERIAGLTELPLFFGTAEI
jgi:uncharacterized protein YfdQ (DUF2303 family)